MFPCSCQGDLFLTVPSTSFSHVSLLLRLSKTQKGMTAWHLATSIHERVNGHVDSTIKNHAGQVDILVTGCEVSLWVAEQFASDLQKCFPKLYVKAVISNNLLGLFGQELSMPSIGFPYTQKTLDMKDPIVILVSHSGGTFASLACYNLMECFSSSIFTVTSE